LWLRASNLHTKRVGQNLFLIDLKTNGFKKLIASYILKGKRTAIVETGPTSSIPNLLLGLNEVGVVAENVAFVALTHVHIDHGGGVGTLLKHLPNAKVLVHAKGAPHLVNPKRLWKASIETLGDVAIEFGEPEPVLKSRIVDAVDGTVLELGQNIFLKISETPGHASHNVSYYEFLNRTLFPGDAAGAYLSEFDTVFPTTPPPFRPDIALISLDKLIRLNPASLCYSHFGRATNAVERLRAYQLQIRRWLMTVEAAVKNGYGEERIREIVLESDESISKVVPFLQSNPVHRKTLIENSVQGFLDFVRNPKI
jgi:glyoxylase-like metal-dependent hydrolase (beta-lactamase superfamily II)